MTPLDIALSYIDRGWNPVPVPFKSKVPSGDNWQTRICEKTNAAQLFNGNPMNVGVLLGITSHGLTDVDLDCPEAVAIAPYVLASTDAIFGRPTNRSSHWLYETDLSVESDQAAVQFRAPDGKMLVELRIGGGGKGAQTIFPGSVHESGEPITWESDRTGRPATADGRDLARRVKTLAAACLIARAWPAKGGRHNAALVVGGVLARIGNTEGVACYLVEAIARAAGDDECKDRGIAARDAVKAYQNGGKAAGLPKLKELVGEPAARRIADWLDYRHLEAPEVAPAVGAVGGDGVTLGHFYSYMPMHRYMFTPARELWPAGSVDARIPPVPLFDKAGLPVVNKKGDQVLQAASTWLDQKQPVEQMTWAPGLPMIIADRLISEGGWIPHKGVSCFNLYRPPFVISGKAAKVDLWVNHIHKIYPNEAEAIHIMRFLAHRVQRPAEKINHALALGGPQGIGKDTMLEPVKRAIGPWNFIEVSPQQVLGRFNGFLKSVILRVSEARDLGEYNRFELYEHMKAYCASPPDVLRIDEKHLREYGILNCVAVVITTNNRTDGIYLSPDDRRHFVAWSELCKEDFTDEYWKKIWGYYASGGDRDIGAYLAELDLKDFNPKAPPLKTSAWWDIVMASDAPEESEFADALDRLRNPAVVSLAQIIGVAPGRFKDADGVERVERGSFLDWLKDRKNCRAIPHRLEKGGYVMARNPDAKDGRWKVNSTRVTIYARANLSPRDRLMAVRNYLGLPLGGSG
jgi:hypothetical protein